MKESGDRPADIFISYAREDRAVVDELAGSLDAAGYGSWVDFSALRGGDQWRTEIARAIKACQVVILICSRASFSSRYVHDELAVADAADPQPRVLPVFIESVAIPDELELMIRSRQWIDLSAAPREEWGARLVDAFEGKRRLSPPRRRVGRERHGITRRSLLIGGLAATTGAIALAARSRLSEQGADGGDTVETEGVSSDDPIARATTPPTLLWQQDLLGAPPTALGISPDTVSFQDSMRSIVCVDSETGAESYRLDLPDTGGFANFLARGGFVYVLHDFDGITALDEDNFLGSGRGGAMAKALEVPLDVIFGEAGVVEDLLIVSTLDPPYGSGIYGDLDLETAAHELRAYDRLTGDLAWESGPVGYGLLTHEGGAFSVDDTGTLRAFDASNGEPRWSSDLAGGGTVVAAGDRLPIVALAGDELIALNPFDGTEIWRTDTPRSISHVARDQFVYVASEGRVWAASAADGDEVWSRAMDDTTGLLIDEGVLYVLRDSEIVGVELATGTPGWTQELGGHLFLANAAHGTLAAAVAGDPTRVVAYGQRSG